MVAGGWWLVVNSQKRKVNFTGQSNGEKSSVCFVVVVVFIKIYQVLPITIIWIYRTLLFTNSAFLLQNDR